MAKTYAELKEETSKAQGVTTPSVETERIIARIIQSSGEIGYVPDVGLIYP